MAEGNSGTNIVVESGDSKVRIVKILVWTTIGGGLIALTYFGFIKPITNWLGLTKDQADKDREQISRKQALSPMFYQQNRDRITMSSAKANESAYNIYTAKGTFWDDEQLAVGSIQRAGTLVNLSYIADVFANNYGSSLQGYLSTFLEDKDWQTIDDFVDKAKKW
jgi:hypothetical protein